jgi:hypothetical protein
MPQSKPGELERSAQVPGEQVGQCRPTVAGGQETIPTIPIMKEAGMPVDHHRVRLMVSPRIASGHADPVAGPVAIEHAATVATLDASLGRTNQEVVVGVPRANSSANPPSCCHICF